MTIQLTPLQARTYRAICEIYELGETLPTLGALAEEVGISASCVRVSLQVLAKYDLLCAVAVNHYMGWEYTLINNRASYQIKRKDPNGGAPVATYELAAIMGL